MGAWLGGISPQDLEHSRQTREELALPFTILSDQGNDLASRCGLTYAFPDGIREIYRTLGIDLPEYNGEDSWILPVPATYLVDATGVIAHRAIDPDFTRLMDPKDLIGQLELLMSGEPA
jgi:peroxiredoxin